ncbi:MAG: hydrogenase small subunit [Kineosporiaceae bacterium]
MHGISRRRFLTWASATAALLMLPDAFRPGLARAAELLNRTPVIWLEGQDCAGNTEALLRASAPTIDELLFQTISLEYHETLMSAAGMQAEERKRQAAKDHAGKYILVIEGSIPNGLDGAYCTIGPQARPFIEEVKELAGGAALVIAAGACAFYGGIPIASPNPTDAVGVSSVVSGKPIVNIPACPLNPANLMGTILHFAMTGQPPALDNLLRPRFAFGYRIHDNCERRAHFDAGEFVERWGDESARNNFCLYRMGCKGPMTFNNCSIRRRCSTWPRSIDADGSTPAGRIR